MISVQVASSGLMRGGARIRATNVMRMAVIGLVYFCAAQFGFLLAFATAQVTAVWPPTAIALVAYIVYGYRVWPGVFIGAFAANLLSHEAVLTALSIGVGNTCAGLVGLSLMRRVANFNAALEKTSDVWGLLVIGAAVGALVSATNGVAQLALSGIVPWSAYLSVWWVWWVGDTMGVVLLAPLLLSWRAHAARRFQAQRIELLVLLACVCSVSYLALGGEIIKTSVLFRFEYAVFPFVIWAALRFTQRETTTVIVIISAAAIWGAIHDRGPFAAGTLDQRLILLNAFMAITAATGLFLGAASTERERARQSLRQANDELEQRVRERTRELARSNSELSDKNEEVEAFVYSVSHDLRAPLVNLQGFSRELQASCEELAHSMKATPNAVSPTTRMILDEEIPGALHFITASTVKFERLIEALLMLSRYGRQSYRRDALDMQAVIQATLDSLQHPIIDSGAEMVVHESLPDTYGDATALGQVFSNLIANALKYRDVTRTCRIEIGGERDGDKVHYWVRDNGLGIPPNAQRRLFQVFQRFHPDVAEGEGMGLAIAKRVVERHGGRIWVDSAEGIGTTFHLTLSTQANFTSDDGSDQHEQ